MNWISVLFVGIIVGLFSSKGGQACLRIQMKGNKQYSMGIKGMMRTETTNKHLQQNGYDDIERIFVHGCIMKSVNTRPANQYPSFLDPDITVLSTNSFPEDERERPTIGNGHIATVIKNDGMFMNGLYNGFNVSSHRARIPSLLVAGIQIKESVLCGNDCLLKNITYSLDVGQGLFLESHTADRYSIELKQYAHRSIKQLLVTELTITNSLDTKIEVGLTVNRGKSSEDITFTEHYEGDILIQRGITRYPEYDITGLLNVTVVSTVVPDKISVDSFQQHKILFLVSIDSKESIARTVFDEGVGLFLSQSLEDLHRQEWSNIWEKGRIDLQGNKTLARITYASLYYILSSLPLEEDPDFVGLSPGDLAHGTLNKDYEGHVFWDQETWMYPSIQMLHDKIGKAIIKTRIRVLDAAKIYASQRGYTGAMFPWESAISGLNVCPGDVYATYEQHITGDIAFAFQQYLLLTNDKNFLVDERGIEAILNIATFWASRVLYSSTSDRYEIVNVMPPDEWHPTVNNSVYTNTIAKISLRLPKLALAMLNRTANKHFEEIASKIYIPFDSKLKYHPEYDGYKRNTTVKQADVVLLGYPLMERMDPIVRRNDLEYYRTVTPGGPAMTWGMFATGYLELNDMETANGLFDRQLYNVVPPFNIWTEEIRGRGAVNFITGMGGYLQSLIFGYGGFRIYPDRLEFYGKLPQSITVFNITGVDYYGGSIDFSFSHMTMKIKQTKIASSRLSITLTNFTQPLEVGMPVFYSNQRAFIIPAS